MLVYIWGPWIFRGELQQQQTQWDFASHPLVNFQEAIKSLQNAKLIHN